MRRADAESSSGFTLVELLMAMTILVIVAGVGYSTFLQALRAYKTDTTQLELIQRTRVGLEQITRDLSSMIVSSGDANFEFYFEDLPGATESEGTDIISFVATVPPRLSNGMVAPSSPLPPSLREDGTTATSDDETTTVPYDILRIAYVLGYDPFQTTSTAADAENESPPLALLRITSPTLSIEDAFSDALIQDPATMLETLDELGASVEVVADHVTSLNLAFYDGEEWTTLWDSEEDGIPKAVRLTLTVEDVEGQGTTFTRSSAATIMMNVVPPPTNQGATAQTGTQPQQQTGNQPTGSPPTGTQPTGPTTPGGPTG
jgi:prepilin-type N-terminal cleavage/methylation domain-containing protein